MICGVPSQKETRNFVVALANEMTTYVQKNLFVSFPEPKVIVYYNAWSFSWGGTWFDWRSEQLVPFILIGAQECFQYNEFVEYDHIEDDEEIGATSCKDWKHHVALVVAHEMAHAVQHYHKHKTSRQFKVPRGVKAYKAPNGEPKDHGKDWQYLYRCLRNEFVNNFRYEELT